MKTVFLLLSLLLSSVTYAFDGVIFDSASRFMHPSEGCYDRLQTLTMSLSTSRYTRAFAYGYDPETDRSACGWAHRENSEEIAMQKAVQLCNDSGLSVECQVVALNGEWIADESLLVPVKGVSGTALTRGEKQQVFDLASSFLLGDCKQQLKGYLQGNTLKAFAYSVDHFGRYACGVGAGTRNNQQSGYKALAVCETARANMKASKRPDAGCLVLLSGNQLQLSAADYGVDFTPPAASLLTDIGLLELQRTAAYMLEGVCNRKFLKYLERSGHKVFAYAVEGNKAVCISESKGISGAAAEHYALSACNRLAEKRRLTVTCDPFAVNDQLQRTAEDFGYAYGSEADYLRVLRNGDLETVRRYVADGYDVNAALDDGGTPLLLAAAIGDRAAFEHFRAAGADMQAVFPHGANVLHSSVMGKNAELVRLLAGETDINAPGLNGMTALSMAAMTGNFYLSYVLVKAGADPDVPDSKGVSARVRLEQLLGDLVTLEDFMREFSELEEAVKYGDHEQIYRLNTEALSAKALDDLLFVSDEPAVIQALLDAGADVEAVRDARSLLVFHATSENYAVISLLLDYGADPEIEDSFGKVAADYTNNQAIKDLL